VFSHISKCSKKKKKKR